MNNESGYLIVCIVIVLVVLFNVGLIFSLTSPATREQLRLLTRLVQRSRNPWQSQDEEMSELRDRVAKFETQEGGAEEPSD
jgi:hypothetical protein